MKRYLVGGAVRDRLLGRPVHEKDWVVTGATAQDMLGMGYVQAGANIPVFIHPETGEEHALARLETKKGTGHKGFIFASLPTVTLEEDLQRRDLTVNAMAQREDGSIVDPWGGREHLQQRLLRHVSEAFVEDPLRVFRVARFAAELQPYRFQVAGETLALMRQIEQSGELATLPAERVWRESARAIKAPAPSLFFSTLQQVGALTYWFPELNGKKVPGLDALQRASRANLPAPWRWAALLSVLPADALEQLHRRLKAPRAFVTSASLAQAQLPSLVAARAQGGSTCYEVLKASGAFRRTPAFGELLRLHLALSDDSPSSAWWLGAQTAAVAAAEQLPAPDANAGAAYGEQLRQARIRALERWCDAD